MKRVDIVNTIMRIDTNTETFNMQDIKNRRFMYSPQTGTLILGVQFEGSEILFSHSEEYHRLGIREDFDKFVRGWIGTGKRYKQGVIHFAPNIPANVPELFSKGFDTLEMFKRNNAKANTVVRGFGRTWEQPLKNIITERQVDLMADKYNSNIDAVGTRQTVTTKSKESGIKQNRTPAQTQQEKLQAITEKLEKGIKDLFASDKYKEYLSVMSKFHNYSFRNTLLILMQKPDASMVAGYGAWQKNFKRQVRRGEKGISIIAPSPYKTKKEMPMLDKNTNKPVYGADGKPLMQEVDVTIPMYKVTTVFDISQTDGEPLPQLGVDKLQGSVDNYKNFYAALEKISPVPIGFENIESGANGYFSSAEQRIAVQENMSELQTMKTLIHEIAHAKLHNITPEEIKDLPPEERKDRRTKEVEADSIAFTVCMNYGLDTSDYTFGYVAGWSSDKELPELQASLTTIQKTANEIISGIDEHFAELVKNKKLSSEKPTPENETVENGFTELSDKDSAEGAEIFEQKDKSADTPTVDESEQKAKAGEPISLMDLAAASQKEAAAKNNTHRLTADEKKIKDAVTDMLKEQIAYSNDGMLSKYKASEQSRRVMWENKIKIENNTVTQNGEPIFSIHRRYSSRKTQGCYRELNPTLEYIKGKKIEKLQEKPSVRNALKDVKKLSEQQPKKSAPSRKKEDLSL
ncbi:MAG: ArdC-like ssDNA-binding domain-containing protein [bacterium]|nr:ArdC-like ssDNA-binding domain-containing protein [bacterium]